MEVAVVVRLGMILVGLLVLAGPALGDERLVWAGPRLLPSGASSTLHAVLPRAGIPIQATLRCEGAELSLGEPVFGTPPGTHWAFKVPATPAGATGCKLSVFCTDGRSYAHPGPITLSATALRPELRPSSTQLLAIARGKLPVALTGLSGELRARLLNLEDPKGSLFWTIKLPPREGQRFLNLTLPKQAPAPGTYLLVMEQKDGLGALAPEPLRCSPLEDLDNP
jgi:hypothetical protein